MAQKLIRDIPDEVLAAIEAKAGQAGMNAEAWIRQKLVELAAQPTIKERYVFKCVGPDAASATLRRFGDGGEPGGGAANLSQAQFAAYKQAQLLVQRNALGDREAAHDLLSKQFEMVFEVPL